MNEPSWDDLRVLLAVFRHESFLAAGRALGMATSTVARRIAAFEASLGRALVQRGPAGTVVDPEALGLVSLAEQLEHNLGALRRDTAALATEISGTVRISSGEGFVASLTTILADLRRHHPGLHVELVAESQLVDVTRRHADLGLRTVRSSSRTLIERNLGTITFGLYASHHYLDRRGRLADLARHDYIGADVASRSPLDAWLTRLGASTFPFRSNSDHARLAAALRGQGVALLADVVGRTHDNLVRLAGPSTAPRLPVYLVHHRDLRRIPRFRVTIHAIATAFREQLA
jgi:DNA-binding transcriptional LysR family regulator